MEPTTDRFIAEISKSHTVYSYVQVTSPTQVSLILPAVGGNVEVDNTAETRRRCSVNCIDPTGELTPESQLSILTPYGTEIRPYRGVAYDDGTYETVPLGVFRIAKVNVRDSVGGSPIISIEAYDRSRTIARDKFTDVYTIAQGTDIVTAIKAIAERTFPDLQYDTVSTNVVTTATLVHEAGDDPWAAITDLALSIGCDVYFGATGWLHIAPPVEIDALPAPVYRYIEGNGCRMLDLERVFTDDPGYNGVVVTGESAGDTAAPVRAISWDEQPSSATYHKGPYGEVPLFVRDQNVKTQSDAQAMADALLQKQLGFSSQLSITGITNPALDAGDVVEVRRERTHVSGLYVVDALTIPFAAADSQSITLRQKRTAQ